MTQSDKKHILITGGTGFIGTALCQRLLDDNYKLTVLSRAPHNQPPSAVRYIKQLDELDKDPVPVDGIINLAGESLAAKRWNKQQKQTFINSRVETTQRLLDYFRHQPPKVVISGSAIGYYGDRGDQVLDEDAKMGTGYAAELCQQWEESAQGFADLGTRLCIVRIGVVLGQGGGPFEEIRKSYDLKVAARMGNGQQWMSWIHLHDMVTALQHLLGDDSLSGVFNCTAPNPVTNQIMTQQMAQQTRAWIKLPLPAPAMRLLIGEMADEILLQGQRVMPQKLLNSGFKFRYGKLSSALTHLLSKYD